MKKTDYNKALAEKTMPQLEKELLSLEKSLATARLQKAAAKLADLSFLKKTSDNIARVKIAMTNKEQTTPKVQKHI